MKFSFPISEDCLILTVNKRLSRYLQLKDAESRKEINQTIWPSSPIHSISDWFLNTYTNQWPDKWVLSSLQSQTLWESILESDSNFKTLDPINLSGAARDARKAYSYIQQYEIDSTASSFEQTEETRSMILWKSAYEGFLKQLGAIDRDHLLSMVTQWTASKIISLPKIIWLAGFDEISPAIRTWIKVAENQGTRFYFFDEDKPPFRTSISLMECETLQEENIQCARWVRQQYKNGNRIGIVATRLNESHRALERELKAELAPESIFVWENPELPFNVSLGYPLIREPMFSPALILLESQIQSIPLSQFLDVVKSPYLSQMDQATFPPIQMEITATKKKEFDINFPRANELLNKIPSKQVEQIKKVLLREWKLFLENRKNRSRNLPSVWARRFTEFLVKLGWPARHRKLDSREIQAYKEWERRLDELASLDTITGPMNRQEAASHLRRLLSDPEKPFQIQTNEDSPIELMGLLESAGQQFDHLWVLGCDADALPEPVSPNPFLPIKLQKRFRLPYSSAERQMAFSQKLVNRLKSAAPNVVFSYSKVRDQQSQTLSPLLSQHKSESTFEILEPSHKSAKLLDNLPPVSLEPFNDGSLIPVTPEELNNIQRGFSTFKNQAECPFRAFSIIRLLADGLQFPETNFENVERGNIVHTILEYFWKTIKTGSQLQAQIVNGTLDQIIEKTIQKAFKDKAYSGLLEKEPYFFELEQNRLTRLLKEWVAAELKNPDFTVLDQEKKERFNFEGFNLTIRVDRIDRLQNGNLLLIDYKTGKVSTNGWTKSPLHDVQLPLYALHLKSDGIAFAQVRKGDCSIKSIQAKEMPNGIPGLAGVKKDSGFNDWIELTRYWDHELKRLAQEFKQGKNDISPVEDEKTCRNCLHGSLCRIADLKQRVESGTEHVPNQ